jgi:hypothetical protein
MVLMLVLASVTASAAERREPPFSSPVLRGTMALPPTRIMVLGVWHLDGADPAFRTEWLAPLLCRLRAFRPDAVLTEAMSGEQLTMLDAYKAYHGAAGRYGGPTLRIAHEAQASLKLDPAQALVQADALATSDPRTPAERRRLAALFAAAAEPFSAVVQWMRLPAGEQTTGDGVSERLSKDLGALAAGRGEIASIAARTAADTGLERVYGAGDHSSDAARPADDVFAAAVAASPGQKALFNHDTPAFRRKPADRVRLATEPEVMQRLRWANSARFGRLDADAQWFSQLRSPTMGRTGRQSVAAWEAQNLRMAIAVREVTAAIPGGRALLVVGAAHKPFVESYLRQLADVEIVSSAAMLNARPAGCSG